MRVPLLLCALLLLLAIHPPPPRAEGGEGGEPAAAANRFVALLDAGASVNAWRELTPLAQTIKSEGQWCGLQQALRTAYGPLEKRTLRGVTLQQRYTMLPDGGYAIVQFDSVFRNKRTTVETIVLALGEDGRWRIHEYVIN